MSFVKVKSHFLVRTLNKIKIQIETEHFELQNEDNI